MVKLALPPSTDKSFARAGPRPVPVGRTAPALGEPVCPGTSWRRFFTLRCGCNGGCGARAMVCFKSLSRSPTSTLRRGRIQPSHQHRPSFGGCFRQCSGGYVSRYPWRRFRCPGHPAYYRPRNTSAGDGRADCARWAITRMLQKCNLRALESPCSKEQIMGIGSFCRSPVSGPSPAYPDPAAASSPSPGCRTV